MPAPRRQPRRQASHHSSASSSAASLPSDSDSDSQPSEDEIEIGVDSQAANGKANGDEPLDAAGKPKKQQKKKKVKAGRRARRRSDDDSENDSGGEGREEEPAEEVTFEEFTETTKPDAGPSQPRSQPLPPCRAQPRSKPLTPGSKKSAPIPAPTVTSTTTNKPATSTASAPVASASASQTAGTGPGKKTKEEKEAERREKRRAKNKERRRKVREGAGVAGTGADRDNDEKVEPDQADTKEAPADAEVRDKPEEQDGQRAEGGPRNVDIEDDHNDDHVNNNPPPISKAPSNRQLYLSRLTADPSFTPRVGSFWTHDERHYSKGKFGEDGEFAGLRGMSGWWRGAGGERGGRGRGRGFAAGRGGAGRGRGGFGFGLGTGNGEKAEGRSVVPPSGEIPLEPAGDSPSAAAAPRADASSSSWGHDAFEKMEQAEKRRLEVREKRRIQQALRGGAAAAAPGVGFAGRGRGRGRGGAVRWGYGQAYAGHQMGQVVFGQDMQQVQSGVQVNGGGQEDVLPADDGKITVKLPRSDSGINVPLASTLSGHTGETASVAAHAHPAVDHSAVVVKLPAAAIDHTAVPVAALPADHGEDSETVANLNLQAEIEYLKSQQATIAQKERQLDEELKRLEIGSRRVDSAAVPVSENGSMSSAPASSSYLPHNGMPYGMPPPPTFVPPGIAMAENGSFFEIATGQPVVFVASNSPAPPGNYSNGPFPPQPYFGNQHPGAGPFFRGGYPGEQHPHLSRGDSFSTFTPPPYGRDSPLGYPSQPVPPGYFAPPRPGGKIQIRAPSSHEVAILKNPGKLGSSEQSSEPHMIPEGQAYSVDNPYAYQNQMMQPMSGQGYYPGMPMHQGYPPQSGYDYGYGQY